MHLKNINAKNIKSSILFMVIIPLAAAGRMRKKDVWIITERRDQARDNGYCFFRYVCVRHPEQEIIYIIDRSAPDYEKVRKIGPVIAFDSPAHYYYYCLSKTHISSHVGGCMPANSPIARRLKKALAIRDVFLPHGVSYGVAEFCLKKYAKIDLFICSGYPEYLNILKNYGYTKKEAVYTGFPRLDLWHNLKINMKQILIMPTWRLYIAQNPDVDFYETAYYKAWQSLINSPGLSLFLEKNGLELVFYLHHEMQKYVDCFSTDSLAIRIIHSSDQCDIQELLKDSALLVTDYSSVHFDFAYMNKPVLYYQFDKHTFFKKQYAQSGFDFEADGFGPVFYGEDELTAGIISCVESGYKVEKEYADRIRSFYRLYDRNNCKRVFQEMKKRGM